MKISELTAYVLTTSGTHTALYSVSSGYTATTHKPSTCAVLYLTALSIQCTKWQDFRHTTTH